MASACSIVDIPHRFRLSGPPSDVPLQERPGNNPCQYCRTITGNMVYFYDSPTATEFQSYGVNSQMLQDSYEKIVEKLPAEEVADILIDYNVLTIDDHDLVMSKKVRKKKAEKLLNIMLSKRQQLLDIFIHVLHEKIPELMKTILPRTVAGMYYSMN
ncbi:hypothetical protein KUTeg_024181 [Tegillarca granosa]|uniref:CARD domain-containing protein n=1 Tax=Tegillarca granosa TaxID=220873 RepID=A0ABQ9DXN2_TEGGR|nr:hypothetical protein KUTeg_024181 [Tegillarca granosa]